MIVAFLGDVVGKSGRRAVRELLPQIRREHGVDIVIANAENSAGGFGFNVKSISDMERGGVDFFTTGNHVWDKPDGVRLLGEYDNIVRPANYPGGAPGTGASIVPRSDGLLSVINIQGRVFMPPIDCPFKSIDWHLEHLDPRTKIVFVDFHCEATSEKLAMGWYLDGRVAVVVGTHTHVRTGDCRVLPNGTGYVTDVGMTGSRDSVLGINKDAALQRFLTMRPTRFEVAKNDVCCDFVIADIDDATGLTKRIEHLQLEVGD